MKSTKSLATKSKSIVFDKKKRKGTNAQYYNYKGCVCMRACVRICCFVCACVRACGCAGMYDDLYGEYEVF